jgi:hypothetical protein
MGRPLEIAKNCVVFGSIVGGYGLSRRVFHDILSQSVHYKKLPRSSKAKILSYFVSLVNAVVCTSYGFKRMFTGANSNKYLTLNILAYLIFDMVATRRQIMDRPSDLIHHLAGIIIGSVALNRQITKISHLLFIVEGSTIFLDISLILKELDLDNTFSYKVSGGLFLASFFLLRIVWMPLISIYIFKKYPEIPEAFGRLKFIYGIVLILQFYWFGLIWKKWKEPMVEIKSKL